MEWDFNDIIGKSILPESFDAVLERGAPLKGAVDYGTLVNLPAAIIPAKSDMHYHVIDEKRLPTFGRAPNHGKADARDYALDEICRGRVDFDLIEGDELETLRRARVRFAGRNIAIVHGRLDVAVRLWRLLDFRAAKGLPLSLGHIGRPIGRKMTHQTTSCEKDFW